MFMEERKTATCWSGAKVWCRVCKGPTRALEDEYGSLADGGSFERFECIEDKLHPTVYVELPD